MEEVEKDVSNEDADSAISVATTDTLSLLPISLAIVTPKMMRASAFTRAWMVVEILSTSCIVISEEDVIVTKTRLAAEISTSSRRGCSKAEMAAA